MKKDHYAKTTIEVTGRRLRLVAKSVNLDDPNEITREVILQESRKLFPDTKILHCFLELIQHMNPLVLQLARDIVKKKGNMDFVGLMTVLSSDSIFESDADTTKKIFDLLKKYPEEYEQIKILIQDMIAQLQNLIND